MPWIVQIIESERGWGQRIDEELEFSDKTEADKFISDFDSGKEVKPFSFEIEL